MERANLQIARLEDIHQKLDQVKARNKHQEKQCKLRHRTERSAAENQEKKHGAIGVDRCELWPNF